MSKITFRFIFLVSIISFANAGSNDMFMVPADSVISLVETYCTARAQDNDSTIYFFFNFDKQHPVVYYEVIQEQNQIVFTFINSKLGGFTEHDSVKSIHIGPIETFELTDQLKDKQEDVKGMKPELYYVTKAVMTCNPMISDEKMLQVTEKDETISVVFPWPSDKKKRKEIYGKPASIKSRRIAISVISGVGAACLAGGGIVLWNYFKNSDRNESHALQPNLPEHPDNW